MGIAHAADRLGQSVRVPTVGMRTGDTPASDRRRLARTPPDLLITTPESLYLMLTSAARSTLAGVEAVIIDEIHAMAATKRGSHLAVSLERLAHGREKPPQRIGLSATQRPLDEIATFLGGFQIDSDGRRRSRPVKIVDAGSRKPLDLEVVVPVQDMGSERSIWPAVHPALVDLVQQHHSTLVFVNARRSAERLAADLNETAGHDLVKAHHGSLAREQRLVIEDELKAGQLRALVATSSLELGIDMGAVDLVVQVGSPGSVAAGLQRIGRAGHQVGEPSRGRIFPRHRGDLLEAAVVATRMRTGEIESTRYPRNPLDVLAQQVVAACAVDSWSVDDLYQMVRSAAPFVDLTRDVWEAVLDMLSGRYPSTEFAELAPRLVWDRATGRLEGRPGTQRLAVTSGGTIPDRGLYGVFLPDGTRVGELDEEMVYESRVGETFLLGASTWRIDDITPERVVVTPAPGQPGKMPFWHGDGPGRPVELGRAMGEFVREVRGLASEEALGRLEEQNHLSSLAASNLIGFLAEQAAATGSVPDDRTIVIERFPDEIGDWRVCILSHFGARIHAPWALALRARLAESWGSDVEIMWSDDGIILRLPESLERLPVDELLIEPEELDEIIVSNLPGSAMFAARFREAAARALLLPRRRPDRRTPLWQQRQRAADLLAVAASHPGFPILLETTRECCNDVFDLPALRGVLTDLRSRKVRVVSVDTTHASPMARSLLFGWVAMYLYEGDAPLAERRAAALALDRDLLRELLGSEELRELLDPAVLEQIELELQRLTPERSARDAHQVADLLRVLGPLTLAEVAARCMATADGSTPDVATEWLRELTAARRVIEVGMAGERRFAAAEDAARLRDALGVSIPSGLPVAFTDPVERPLHDLVIRHARTHGPFLTSQVVLRLGAPLERVLPVLEDLVAEGRLLAGEFRPGGRSREWCDPDVLRAARRRSLAALRSEVEPVDAVSLARFLPAWQGVGSGVDLVEVVSGLAGAALVASTLEVDVLAVRLDRYQPADLDALCTAGEIVWVGAGGLGGSDGRVRLVFRDQVDTLIPPVDAEELGERLDQPVHAALHRHLSERGASFWADLTAAVPDVGPEEVLVALWDLVWAGILTNDSLAPVRARVGQSRPGTRGSRAGPRGRSRPGRASRAAPAAAVGRWSLVGQQAVGATDGALARAAQLLERYGVLTRETALAEGVEGGFAGVYPVLKLMEEQGRIRRGYFVAGLGAAQFAVPGAVDRLRAHREMVAAPLVLAATDPAQPYGAVLAWPPAESRPTRSAGALVVLVNGEATAFVERGGRSLVTFPAAADHPEWVEALADVVRSGRRRSMELTRLDGVPARESPLAEVLRGVGFVDGYRGLVLRGSSVGRR